MDEIILHHYPESPFSEKIRLALGHKGLAWRSVRIPNMMPKPDLIPLTGGYRRTPVLQIGADVFCDTQVIVRELERRHPEPTLHPDGARGLDHALFYWSDRAFFQAAVAVIFGEIGPAVPKDFIEDRSQMMNARFDVQAMKAAVPLAREQLRGHLALVEDTLSDGRRFLRGDALSLADLNAFHTVWFLRNVPPAAGEVNGFPLVAAWFEHVAAIGHGSPQPMDAKQALDVAAAGRPAVEERIDQGGRFAAGARVQVFPDDYGRDPVVGQLVVATTEELAVRRSDPRVGDVVVHFPRLGFVLLPA
jgi:glutathione S-transferase